MYEYLKVINVCVLQNYILLSNIRSRKLWGLHIVLYDLDLQQTKIEIL